VTWASFVARGSGAVEWRLVIEGFSLQFCTAVAMEGTLADGRTRVSGLRREGIVLSESVYMAGPDLDLGSFTAQIGEDHAGLTTAALTAIPRTVGWLGASVNASATSWTLKDTSQLTVGDFLHIGTEVVKVKTIPTGTTITVAARSEWQTTGQAHDIETGAHAILPELTDYPPQLEGRRVWLYAHTEEELTTADHGTLVWRGVVGAEPELEDDAATWSLLVDPLTRLLDGMIAAELDRPLVLRGIYYAWTGPVHLRLMELNSASITGLPSAYVTAYMSGFYETQEAFCAALQVVVDAAVASPSASGGGGTFKATYGIVPGPDRWEIHVTTDATTPLYATVMFGGSWADGWVNGLLTDTATGDITSTVATSSTYVVGWGTPDGVPSTMTLGGAALGGDYTRLDVAAQNPGAVPRANYSQLPALYPAGARWLMDYANEATWPENRVYLASVSGVAAGDVFSIETGGEPVSLAFPPIGATANMEIPVDAVDATDGFITLAPVGTGLRYLGIFVTLGAATFALARSYGTGTIADFRDGMIADAPGGANSGGTPWITGDDLASWTTIADIAAGGRAWLTRRRYVFSNPVALSDVLREECRAYGVYYHLDADAKIALDTLAFPSQVEVGTALDGDDHITDGGGGGGEPSFGTIAYNADGKANVVKMLTGWNRRKEEHTGQTYVVRNVAAISRAKTEHVTEVGPMVASDGALEWEDAVSIADPLLKVYGARRYLVSMGVPWTRFGVLVGSVVSLTIEQLPYDGARRLATGSGLSEVKARVIGRRWPIDAASGTLTMLITDANIAGYAPTGRVSSASGSGTAWTVTLEANRYAPTGDVDASYFEVGDLVRLVEWDASIPTIKTGVVDAVSGNDVDVTLDASWAGVGGSTWNLSYQPDTVALQAGQLLYAFVGGSAWLLTSNDPARVYAP